MRTLTLSLGFTDERVSAMLVALRGTVRFVADETIPTLAGRITDALGATYEGETEVDSIASIVIGLCLYLASAHPHVEPVAAPPRTRRERRAKGRGPSHEPRASRLAYIKVGRPASHGQGVSALGRGALARQIWVRGHWRHQAHGPRHSLRRWTWIEPYLKGPDFAERMESRTGRVQRAQPAEGPTDPHPND